MLIRGMADRPLDAQIDALYQLPLDEFTAARNTLAKQSGAAAADVRALQKPPLAAWAINQVYWRARPAFHALTASAAALREAHTSAMVGKAGKQIDLRAAGQAHEEALEAVLKAAVEILRGADQTATDATRQAIATTLRALPGATDPPGRLTQTMQPTGFELLAGLPTGLASGAPATAPTPARSPASGKPAGARTARDAARDKAIAKAKDALAGAQRAERAAEQNARREEFEAARTTREAERAAGALDKAREALEAAQEAVDAAEREAEAANRKQHSAARRVRESSEALAAARVRTQAAQSALTES